MKKIIYSLFFLSCLLPVSCSSDDIGDLTYSELIIGVWKPIKYVLVDYEGESETKGTYEGCAENNSLTFGNHRAYRGEFFFESDSTGECFLNFESNNSRSGTWDILEDNTLRRFVIYGDGSNTLLQKLVFQGKNTMRIIYTESTPNPDYDYGYTEYIRLE